jgi:hypothetical protein
MSVRLVSDPIQHPLISTGSSVHGSLRLSRPPRPAPCEVDLVCDSYGGLFSCKRTAFDPSKKGHKSSSDWKREAEALLQSDASLDTSINQSGSAKRIASRLVQSQCAEIFHHQSLLNAPRANPAETTQRAAQSTAVMHKFSPYLNRGKSSEAAAARATSIAALNSSSSGLSGIACVPLSDSSRLPLSDLPTTNSDYGCYYDSTGSSSSNDRFLGSLVNSKELWPTFERTSKRTGIGGNRANYKEQLGTSETKDWKSLHQKEFRNPKEVNERLQQAMSNPSLKEKALINSTAGSLGFGPKNPHYRAYLASGIDKLLK